MSLGFVIFSLGAVLLWLGQKNSKYISLGFITLSFSVYGAHAEIILAPLFISLFLVIFRNRYFSNELRSHTIVGLIMAGVVQIPNLGYISPPRFS